MKKAALIVAAFATSAGCANITPPPDLNHWDSVPPSTQCTASKSAVNGQYAASLLASVLGGLDIGASIATGGFPIIGIPLAALGITGAADVDEKYDQIDKCVEFKKYTQARSSKEQMATKVTTEDKLNKLRSMLDRSIITEQEYEQGRKDILSQM